MAASRDEEKPHNLSFTWKPYIYSCTWKPYIERACQNNMADNKLIERY